MRQVKFFDGLHQLVVFHRAIFNPHALLSPQNKNNYLPPAFDTNLVKTLKQIAKQPFQARTLIHFQPLEIIIIQDQHSAVKLLNRVSSEIVVKVGRLKIKQNMNTYMLIFRPQNNTVAQNLTAIGTREIKAIKVSKEQDKSVQNSNKNRTDL